MRHLTHYLDSSDNFSCINTCETSYSTQNPISGIESSRLEVSQIPSVLEIIDLSEKTFKVSAVALMKAPIMLCYYKHFAIPVILDTGAEYNVIADSQVKRMNILVSKTSARAIQVDKSPLHTIGSVSLELSNGEDSWLFSALVCTGVGDVIIAGNPFLAQGINPITYKKVTEIVSSDGSVRSIPWRPTNVTPNKPSISLLRSHEKTTIFPEEYLELPVPADFTKYEASTILINPRQSSNIRMVNISPHTIGLKAETDSCHTWPTYDLVPFPQPQFAHIIGGKVRIQNNSPLPITVNRNSHIADIRIVVPQKLPSFEPSLYPRPKPTVPVCEAHKIIVDPDDQLTPDERKLFNDINTKYSTIFSSKPGKYNGSLGNLDAKLILNNSDIDPPSFPCKRILQSEKLDDIKQDIMDQMEADGILVRPEDVNVHVTHVHPSFLVPKMEDGRSTGEYRLVTNLQSLSPYIKPTRIPLPTIDDAFRKLGKWNHIILLDLRSWHWQIPMNKSSMRYLGTTTPYGGDRVYAVQPQGYLNATENSDRVIQRVLEPAVRQKKCIRMANNIIVVGVSVAEAAANYELILKLCGGAGLTFKASKTIICPLKVNILGKVWKKGYLSPSEHLLSTLSKVPPPITVKQMRSFLGGCKQMKDNIKNYTDLFKPLEKVTGGRKSSERIVWDENLRTAFNRVQKATENPDILALPRPGEKLFIFPDWSDENQSGGAPLYVKRDNRWIKVRNFSQRLRTAKRWSPCEGEAWMIKVAVENHAPWIYQSGVPCEIGTDNSACVLSFQRLRRGQFSRSVRVAYMLSTLAEHNVYLVHRSGTNHPGDFDSRHPIPCTFGKKCQVCVYAHDLAGPMAHELAHPGQTKLPTSVAAKTSNVNTLSVDDVLCGKADLPFTQRAGWRNIQDNDKTLQDLKMHITGGTIPMRRNSKQPELRKLYNLFQHQKLTISKDGLVVKLKTDNFGNTAEVIVVPKIIMKGLLTALHVKFDHPHPSKPELKKICDRYWFSVDLDTMINSVWLSCHKCQSLAPVPKEIFQQSTVKSGKLGSMWSADVIRGHQQFIFIAREKLSSFTVTKLIPNESSQTLREAIITCTVELIPEEGLLLQVDNCPALVSIQNDAELARFKIKIDVARKKNKDSNPIAEKAVKEFRLQSLKFKPEGGKISDTERALITSSLNKTVRNRNVSSKEILLNRDQFTSEALHLDDSELANKQLVSRQDNHPLSAKSKVKNGVPATPTVVWPGALVFLKKDISKLKGRDLYIVVSLDENDTSFCFIKKAVKQLRVENYKVKLTEIVLSPNQIPPDEDNTVEDLTLENDTTQALPPSRVPSTPTLKYNLRRRPKKSRKGSIKIASSDSCPMLLQKAPPPKYAWDSYESSDDDDIGRSAIELEFELWCRRQQFQFVPSYSIFMHWFKDKYRDLNTQHLHNSVTNLVGRLNLTGPDSDEISSCNSLDASKEMEDNDLDVISGSPINSLPSSPIDVDRHAVFLRKESDCLPTARHSSTDMAVLEPTCGTNLLTSQTSRQSVILCPTGTCAELELPTSEVEVFSPEAPDSPAVSRSNYPILFNFTQENLNLNRDMLQQPLEPPPPPQPPDASIIHSAEHQILPSSRASRFPRVNYQQLHLYGRQHSSSLRRRRRGGEREEDERCGGEGRGAPE